jgi:serine/threonine-protein kinase
VASDAAPSVAVLPFANLGGGADDEYFSDGITDEVLGALTRVRGVRVAARTSSFAFKGQRVDLRTVAERLGVGTVLEGSVRRAGSRVRIAVQLVSAADGLTLWSERYDRELADIFAVQEDIARAIAGALERTLAQGAAAGTRGARVSHVTREGRGAVDPEAFEQYLRGRHLLEQRDRGMAEALASFERAMRLDPEFAAPHAGTGLAFALFGVYHAMPPREAFPRARDAAERALALDPSDALAVTVRAYVALWYEWDPEAAERLARRALELAPGSYHSHDCLGWALAGQGRFAEAETAMQSARALDPLSDWATYDLGWMLILAGRFERVVEELRPAVARHPQSSEVRHVYAYGLFHSGRVREALAEFEAVLALNPGSWGPANLAQGLAAAGREAEARRLLEGIEARLAREPLPIVGLAIGYHALGDDEAALAWLERAVAARDSWLVMLRHDPSVRRLVGDPRFERIMRRVRPGDAS